MEKKPKKPSDSEKPKQRGIVKTLVGPWKKRSQEHLFIKTYE